MNLCKCGCSNTANVGREYIKGHNRRGVSPSEDQRTQQSEFMRGNNNLLGKTWTLSEEAREKHRKCGLSRVNDDFRKFMSEVNKLRVFSSETRQKMSDRAKEKIGALNPNWGGGISFLPYSSEFNSKTKKIIEERDRGICQVCGKEKKKYPYDRYAVHHIDYNKNNTSGGNLIFLCEFCHNRTNGVRSRKFWRKFLARKIKTNGAYNAC
jgi:hypothetical protein